MDNNCLETSTNAFTETGAGSHLELLRKYVGEKLCSRSTYIIAFIVGTFINLYGQILVPWLRGSQAPFASFVAELRQFPMLVLLSVFIAYCFPVMVATVSGVLTRFGTQQFELKAMFPDLKPDPVFRASADGAFKGMGAQTQTLFQTREVCSAQDAIGEDAWRALLLAARNGDAGSTRVFSKPLGAWYLVTHASGPSETIHVYMTRTPSPDAAVS